MSDTELNLKLYQIPQFLEELFEKFIDEDGVIMEWAEEIIQKALDLEKFKLNNIVEYYKQLWAVQEWLKFYQDDIKSKLDKAKKKQETAKNFLDTYMKTRWLPRLETGIFVLSYRKSSSIVLKEWSSMEWIPEEFLKKTIELRKTEIKDALKKWNTELLNFVEQKESQSLQIK